MGAVGEALRIFGGYGCSAEQATDHYFRDPWAIGVELGTEEELKDVISEKEPSSFKMDGFFS